LPAASACGSSIGRGRVTSSGVVMVVTSPSLGVCSRQSVG
jgi:hypothetical protein